MKTKIFRTFFKARSILQNRKGQALVESLFVAQVLLVSFLIFGLLSMNAWNAMIVHWLTHETLVCESLSNTSKTFCRSDFHGKVKQLLWGSKYVRRDIFKVGHQTRASTEFHVHWSDLLQRKYKSTHELDIKAKPSWIR